MRESRGLGFKSRRLQGSRVGDAPIIFQPGLMAGTFSPRFLVLLGKIQTKMASQPDSGSSVFW